MTLQEYKQSIIDHSYENIKDLKQCTTFSIYHLIGIITSSVAQMELKLFNHFIKSNKGILSKATPMDKMFNPMWVGRFSKKLIMENYKISIKKGGYEAFILDVWKFAETLKMVDSKRNPKNINKVKKILNNFMAEKWNLYITHIIKFYNSDQQLDWLVNMREYRHLLVHSVESEKYLPFRAPSTDNILKSYKTIFDAEILINFSYYMSNFDFKSFQIKPKLLMFRNYLEQFIERYQVIFGFATQLNRKSENKVLFANLANNQNTFTTKINGGNSLRFRDGRVVYVKNHFENPDYWNQSFFSSALNIDTNLDEFGVPTTYYFEEDTKKEFTRKEIMDMGYKF